MGANNGSGQPYFFQCSKCRKEKGIDGWKRRGRGGKDRIQLTGIKKDLSNSGNSGGRNSTHARQYRCLDCGHVGFSRHHDLEVLEVSRKK